MLPESRLYSFIDQKEGFTLHYLEGQKLIHDLALIHDLKGEGFSYFRDAVLTLQPLISFLKPGEGLGLFIDSEIPYFRFKIETNHTGLMRTLLIPESFNQFPKLLTGVCRLAKLLPGNVAPYNSIINLEQVSFKDIANKVLKDSYQVKSSIKVSQEADHSILLTKLPPKQVDSELSEGNDYSLEEFWNLKCDSFESLFNSPETDQEKIQKAFEKAGFTYLGSKEVKFQCSCSYERMLDGVSGLANTSGMEDVFPDGSTTIETRCDYCKTCYQIERQAVIDRALEMKSAKLT